MWNKSSFSWSPFVPVQQQTYIQPGNCVCTPFLNRRIRDQWHLKVLLSTHVSGSHDKFAPRWYICSVCVRWHAWNYYARAPQNPIDSNPGIYPLDQNWISAFDLYVARPFSCRTYRPAVAANWCATVLASEKIQINVERTRTLHSIPVISMCMYVHRMSIGF